MDLESLESIRRLKYRYFRALDLKRWDELEDTLTEDVQARYGTQAMDTPLHFDNRADVVRYMSENLGTGIITIHIGNYPEIDVEGDTATGSWAFEDTVIVPDFKVTIRGGGYYSDQYRREAGTWRISATGYERIYEAMTSIDDTPSFKLLANRWDPAIRR
ncbi:nuclear transport factor 2 family protein [Aeromicrobium sp.]|uniref:nuclear transport factor 2 family protein n=1 Tax=Aeromicrobium sp. TaxID=1871063 RepID=UPI0030BE0BB1